MKLTFIYLFIPLFLLLLSCQKSNKEISNVQEIDCSFDESMTIKMSEITDSIEIVPLETKEESFIGMASKIKTYNRKYYIGTGMPQINKILVFNANGEYITQLDKVGAGPDEYTEIKDFIILNDSIIALTTHADPRILMYNIYNKQCILNKRITAYPTNIISDKNSLYLLCKSLKLHNAPETKEKATNPDMIQKYNLKGEFVGSLFPADEIIQNKINYINPSQSFYADKEDLYFSYPWCDTIYSIQDKQATPVFFLNYGEKRIPEQAFQEVENIMDIMKRIHENEGIFLGDNYEVHADYVYVGFEDTEENNYLLLYNRKNKTVIKGCRLVDDLLCKGNVYKLKSAKSIHDGILTWSIEMDEFKDFYERLKSHPDKYNAFRIKYKQLIPILEDVKGDENPILINMKIKL